MSTTAPALTRLQRRNLIRTLHLMLDGYTREEREGHNEAAEVARKECRNAARRDRRAAAAAAA